MIFFEYILQKLPKSVMGILLLLATQSNAQTIVRGVVTDATSKQPIQYVSVVFKGGRGAVTNAQGEYVLQSQNPASNQVLFSYVGYKTITKTIQVGKDQTINLALQTDPNATNSITVSTNKRAPYRNKNNPAVELIKKVIKNKSLNRIEKYDYVQYQQYEKIQLSLSNASAKITNAKLLKKYQFLFQNSDTTKIEGKSLLPIYLEEVLSQKYYRKNPEKSRTIVLGEKHVNFGEYVDNAGISSYLNRLYMDVDIYDNDIPLFTYQFLSPIAELAPSFYMYYIKDTVTNSEGKKMVQLYFTPRVTGDLLFRGNMYVTLDGNYAVQKINMYISKNANLNWVKELRINLDFEANTDGRYHLSKSTVMADAGITKAKGNGFFGERTVSYKNFVTNIVLPDTLFKGPEIEKRTTAASQLESFWQQNRHDTLTKAESKVYANIDSLEKMPSFKRTMALATLLLAGYTTLGPAEIGPVNAFYSFNPVEGFRLRFGGRTTPKLSKRLYFEGYGAYGFKDEKWKYFISSTYSINNKSIYQFPLNFVRVSYQKDTKIPGQELQFLQEDNFLLSFKRGNNDKWLYNDYFRVDYVREFANRFSYTLGFKNWRQQPAGAIVYNKMVNGIAVNIPQLTTTEFSANVRWAPKEQFYQGKVYRTPIVNKYPIFNLSVTAGVKGLLNSEYNYQKIDFNVEKRCFLSQLGYSDVVVNAGVIFGQIPYPLMNIHRANQTYAYQLNSYNLMNFLEFVSDRYAGISVDHHFNGLFFNRIPLLKKLKLRELVSVKALWGSVSANNNPNIHPELYQYPTLEGKTTTFSLNQGAYVEGSAGIGNIFKLIRVDVVKRFSYLNNPYVSPMGIRARFKFDF